jgi:transcriptional accessory protein Tex/SPT6
MLRAENEGFIKFKVEVDLDEAYDIIDELVLKSDSPATPHVQLAIEDSYKRLLILLYQTKLYRKRKPRLMPIRFRFCY